LRLNNSSSVPSIWGKKFGFFLINFIKRTIAHSFYIGFIFDVLTQIVYHHKYCKQAKTFISLVVKPISVVKSGFQNFYLSLFFLFILSLRRKKLKKQIIKQDYYFELFIVFFFKSIILKLNFLGWCWKMFFNCLIF
jgi:hypothetical protein